MKTIILKVRNLPNSVDTDLFVYCMQQDVAVAYPRGKVELVQDIERYDIDILKKREAKNGYWVHPTSQDCHCSECGEQPAHEPGGSVPLYDFCPYCGAKMEVKWNELAR